MKLNLFLAAAILCFASVKANAQDNSPGLRFIHSHGVVRCGTDLRAKVYAYRDKDKIWRGIDADLCRALSMAIFGRDDRFQMIDVAPKQISNALRTNKIDVMFGNTTLSAKEEMQGTATAAEVMYYDRQMFLAYPIENASSMEEYKDLNVCVLDRSEDLANLNDFNRKYALGLRILPAQSLSAAKESFYLKRCNLFSASEVYLRGLANSVVSKNVNPVILPEVAAYRPVYAYVDRNNASLRLIVKWVINALRLAEQHEINSQNIDIVIGVTDSSTRNLLGDKPELWQAFGLNPEWFRQAIKQMGNFGEIYEKNLGKESPLKIERDKNYLIDRGGMLTTLPFI